MEVGLSGDMRPKHIEHAGYLDACRVKNRPWPMLPTAALGPRLRKHRPNPPKKILWGPTIPAPSQPILLAPSLTPRRRRCRVPHFAVHRSLQGRYSPITRASRIAWAGHASLLPSGSGSHPLSSKAHITSRRLRRFLRGLGYCCLLELVGSLARWSFSVEFIASCM